MQGLKIKINVIKRQRGKKLQNRPFLRSLILRRSRSFAVPFASLPLIQRGREAKGTMNDLGRLRIRIISELLQACFITKLKWKAVDINKNGFWGVFWHEVTVAILVSQNNETAAMLVSQNNPLGVELFSYANVLFCSNEFAEMLAIWVKTLYSHANISCFHKKGFTHSIIWKVRALELGNGLFKGVLHIFFFVDLIINLVSSDRLIKPSPIKKTHLLCL